MKTIGHALLTWLSTLCRSHIRRECSDHVIVLNERHLNRLLRDYFDYYHRWQTHRSLDMDCSEPRP